MKKESVNKVDLENIKVVLFSKKALKKFNSSKKGSILLEDLLKLSIEELEGLQTAVASLVEQEECNELAVLLRNFFDKFFSPDTNIFPLQGKYIKDEYPMMMEEANKSFYLKWELGKRNNNWAIFNPKPEFMLGRENRTETYKLIDKLNNRPTIRTLLSCDDLIPFNGSLKENYGIIAITRDFKFVRYYFNRKTREMLPEYKDKPDNIDKLI